MYDNINKKDTKFLVLEFLNKLPKTESDIANKSLPIALGISRQTWHKYKHCSKTDPYDLPFIHAVKLANYFGCKVEELINISIEPLTIHELIIIENQAKASNLGLTK